MNDSIVNEVRKFRDEHAKKFNYNLSEICKDLIKKQELHSARVVSLKNNPLSKSLI